MTQRAETRLEAALAATRPARQKFLSAVGLAADEIEGRYLTLLEDGRRSARRLAQEMGSFADGRIDPQLVTALMAQCTKLSPAAFEAMTRSVGVLREIERLEDEDFVVRVKAGQCLSGALGDKLARLGCAFGAAEVAALAGVDGVPPSDLERRLESFHPDDWSSREREFAPPLVVVADGSAMHVEALRDWLEGDQKLVFVVEGASPPAPLASLIQPGPSVTQSQKYEDGAGFARTGGPAVCAWVQEGVAVFKHDPNAASEKP